MSPLLPNPTSRRVRGALIAALIVVIGLALLSLGTPTPVEAAVAGRYSGHTWAGDGTSFLGSYRLADGTVAYCIDQPSGPPMGVNYSAADYAAQLTDLDSQARLAYLMRQWGSSTDPTTSAAVALNVWRITGLGGHTDRYYAARANESTAAVLAAADAQLAEAGSSASRHVAASVTVTVTPDGQSGSVQADVTVDGLSGIRSIAPGTHAGTVTLEGGVFTDTGAVTGPVTNGVPVAITPDVRTVVTISATARFDDLPYGAAIGLLYPDDPARQRLIVAAPAAAAATSARVVAPPVLRTLPFQPSVQTQTGTATAEQGTTLTDTLVVSVQATAENPQGDWGMRGDPASAEPVALLVRSTLWGPFVDPITELASVPADAPLVCEMATMVAGPGEYRTEACTLPTAGYYVWTERINPADSPDVEGRQHAGAWQSAFGVATEVTVAQWHPVVTTAASQPATEPGACLHDTLTISGAQPGYDLPMRANLWGPFVEAPFVGATIDAATSLLVGTADVSATGDGIYQTPCLTATEPGHYVWTHESAGTAATPAFASSVVFGEEMTLVQPPAAPVVLVPSTVPVPRTVPVPSLAKTGVNGELLSGLGWIGSVSVLLGAGTTGVSLARRGRGRHRA